MRYSGLKSPMVVKTQICYLDDLDYISHSGRRDRFKKLTFLTWISLHMQTAVIYSNHSSCSTEYEDRRKDEYTDRKERDIQKKADVRNHPSHRLRPSESYHHQMSSSGTYGVANLWKNLSSASPATICPSLKSMRHVHPRP
jgi:hypothetical protein